MTQLSLRMARAMLLALSVHVLAAAPSAGAPLPAETRNLIRCDRALTDDGSWYYTRLTNRIMRCAKYLSSCDLTGVPTDRRCTWHDGSCDDLTQDLASIDRNFRNTVAYECRQASMDLVLDRLGMRAVLGDCEVTSPETLARCVATTIVKQEGIALRRILPRSCDLLSKQKLSSPLLSDLCAPEPVCEECEECEECEDCEECQPCDECPDQGTLACGGPTNLGCPTGMVCDRRDALCANASAYGTCVPAPTSCTPGTPVCGCDGQTYPSDCDRLMAGVTMQRSGMCSPAPTPCARTVDCAAGLFCELPEGDCGEGAVGVCLVPSREGCDICSEFLSSPICGCDGLTYLNDCSRRAAGVAKFFDGACNPDDVPIP